MSSSRKRLGDSFSSGRFSVLLKIEWNTGLREPYGLGMGLIFPVILLFLFGFIGKATGGGNYSGLTLIEIWLPTIIVVGFISLSCYSIPITIVRDREIGWLKRISTTPLSSAKLLAAHLTINLIYAAILLAIIIPGGIVIFNAALNVSVFYFSISIILALLVLFSIGLIIASIAPNQRAATVIAYPSFMGMMFLAGLWVQPSTIGNPLRTIMWYSPPGAAARTILYSIYNTTPPFMELVAALVYAIIFLLIAIRLFRWN